MSIVFWDSDETGYTGETWAANEWDRVVLGGNVLPGICSVRATAARAVDKKRGAGFNGARVTVQGYDPQPVEIHVRLWTPEQWDYWQALHPLFFDRAKKKTIEALDIYHPSLALLGINSVVVSRISSPEQGTTRGEISIRIMCEEWSPPKKRKVATRTPTASKQRAQIREDFVTPAPANAQSTNEAWKTPSAYTTYTDP